MSLDPRLDPGKVYTAEEVQALLAQKKTFTAEEVQAMLLKNAGGGVDPSPRGRDDTLNGLIIGPVHN